MVLNEVWVPAPFICAGVMFVEPVRPQGGSDVHHCSAITPPVTSNVQNVIKHQILVTIALR